METLTSWEREGMEKERQSIALNMLKDNFSLEQISRLTGLTIAQLQQLQADHP
jgi:predicted transposase YdaD